MAKTYTINDIRNTLVGAKMALSSNDSLGSRVETLGTASLELPNMIEDLVAINNRGEIESNLWELSELLETIYEEWQITGKKYLLKLIAKIERELDEL